MKCMKENVSYLPECPSPTDSDVKRKVFPDFLLPKGFMMNADWTKLQLYNCNYNKTV